MEDRDQNKLVIIKKLQQTGITCPHKIVARTMVL